MTNTILRIGIAGLGGAGSKLLPSFAKLEGITLTAAADVRAEAREAFQRSFDRPSYSSVADMCRSAEVDAVYVATPSHLHCEHTLAALRAGKHVICEKPLATSLYECDRMIAAAQDASRLLIQGHSKVFDAPVRAMHQIIASGRLGAVFQVDCWNYNDWMLRPRLAVELDTRLGGGVVFRQAPQMIDLARFLIGTMPLSVRAVTGRHAKGLDTEGNFSAFLTFAGGQAATLSFNGYGHFDAGLNPAPSGRNATCARRFGPADIEEKYPRINSAGHPSAGPNPGSGILARICCEYGVLALSGTALSIHADSAVEVIALDNGYGRAAALIEMRDALREKRPVFPDGQWARTTLEVCLAILESSKLGKEIRMSGQ